MTWSLVDWWGDPRSTSLWNGRTYDWRCGDIRVSYNLSADYMSATDFDFFSDTAQAGDWIAFGYYKRSWGISLNVAVPFQADSVEFVWEYWRARYSGTTLVREWVPLEVTNPNALCYSGEQQVTWDAPDDWYGDEFPNGSTYDRCFWVRCRIVSVSGLTEGGRHGDQIVQWCVRGLVASGTESLWNAWSTSESNGWGVFWLDEQTDTWVSKVNLIIGDGATTTSVSLTNTSLKFYSGVFLHVNEKATLTLGSIVNEGTSGEYTHYGCQIWESFDDGGPNFGGLIRVRGDGALYVYDTRWTVRKKGYAGAYLWYFYGDSSVFKAVDSVFQQFVGEGFLSIHRASTAVLRRCRFTTYTGLDLAKRDTTIEGVSTTYQLFLYTGGAGSEAIAYDISAPLAKVWLHGGKAFLRNCNVQSFTPGYSHMSGTDGVYLQSSLDLSVLGEDFNPLSGASVEIRDVEDTLVFSGTTGEDGTIETQWLNYAVGYHPPGASYFEWTYKTPHTVTISAPGYETRMLYLNMDRKREEVEVLEAYVPEVTAKISSKTTRATPSGASQVTATVD